MNDSIALGCRCGKMAGVVTGVSRNEGNYIICYCDDCQAYARFLGRDDIVDGHGGTAIYQTMPLRVTLTSGNDELRCMRLSNKGMLRFYTACCRTPVANTMTSSRMPFVGLVESFIRDSGDGRPKSAFLGPVVARVMGRAAIGGVPPGAHPTMPLSFTLRAISKLARWFILRGHRPSPFFDEGTHRPVVLPEILSATQRRALVPVSARDAQVS